MTSRIRTFDRPLAGVAVLYACLLAPFAHADQVLELRPNIQPLPPDEISIDTSIFGTPELRFSAHTGNIGAGPLELVAGAISADGLSADVYQRIYLTDGNYYDHYAGTFEYDLAHAHFHFQNFELYSLKPVKGNSQRTASKTTYCLMDNESIDPTLPGAPASPYYSGCGETVQGISVGWGDIYNYKIPGQSIDLSKLKDGDYRLFIQADPDNLLLEGNENDNISCALLHISVTNMTVDVLNPTSCDTGGSGSGGGDVTVTGIDPNSASAGSTVQVTVTGSGFISGMNVSFQNGSGPQPSASNVTVVDDTHITATVTVKNRNNTKYPDYVWDVVVGSGVLTDGFIVSP
jgi:hypothetical protein